MMAEKPDYAKRTEDLAREVLRDLKALEHTKYELVQSKHFDPTSDMQVPYGALVPAIKLEFSFPEDDRCPAFLVHIVNYATGSIANDEVIKYRIRQKVEEYLKSISRDPGFNVPEDMRLDAEFYA